jgi:cobalt-precorrin 5A hydrolase
MGLGEAMIIAGIGTRKGVDAAEVVALIERALAEAHIEATSLSAIATAAGKAGEPGIIAAAAQLGLQLLPMSTEAMQAGEGGIMASSCSARLFGVSSVSEASALAAAGQGSLLILPRIKSARATCALASTATGELGGQTHGSDPILRALSPGDRP